jgi:hypothetical protein
MPAYADAGGTGASGFEPRPAGEALAAVSADGLRLDLVEPFCARRGGRLLHRTACGWVARITESERIAFKRAAEGGELGLMRCPACNPEDAEVAA